MRKYALGVIGMVGMLFLTACWPPTSQPSTQVKAPADQAAVGIEPQVSINAVMVAFVDHAAHNLWDVERKDGKPMTDADWEVVSEHAVQIAAAGAAITSGGTGPSDDRWSNAAAWRSHAQRMSGAGVQALRAAERKDVAALVEANSQLVDSCENCHKEFKPSLPTEGIVHRHTR
jgi:Cytochrome C'